MKRNDESPNKDSKKNEVNYIEKNKGEETNEENNRIDKENKIYNEEQKIPYYEQYNKEYIKTKEYTELSQNQIKNFDKIPKEKEKNKKRECDIRKAAALLAEMEEEGDKEEAWSIKSRIIKDFKENDLQEDENKKIGY